MLQPACGTHAGCFSKLFKEGKMKGSALVMEFADRAAVDEYLAKEPYVVEGVWQKIEVEPMNVVLLNGDRYSG